MTLWDLRMRRRPILGMVGRKVRTVDGTDFERALRAESSAYVRCMFRLTVKNIVTSFKASHFCPQHNTGHGEPDLANAGQAAESWQ